MALNPFFLHGSKGEQNLVQDLINEQLKMFGVEVYYIPRIFGNEKSVMEEVSRSNFANAIPIEGYVETFDGYSGAGTLLSKFGVQELDDLTLIISRERYEEEIQKRIEPLKGVKLASRPKEGDLIYFPLTGKIYEVKFIEHESIFYQMGALQTYDLTCELFQYSHEVIDTGRTAIDQIEDDYSGDALNFQITDEAGNIFTFEDSAYILQEGYRIENTDKSANNEFFGASTNIDFIDFSEGNPFSEGANW